VETKSRLFIAILVIAILSIVVVVIYYSSSFVPRRPSIEGIDLFGIDEIYPTKEGGREWFVDMENPFSDNQKFRPICGVLYGRIERNNMKNMRQKMGNTIPGALVTSH
jgi:hypothetical protein